MKGRLQSQHHIIFTWQIDLHQTHRTDEPYMLAARPLPVCLQRTTLARPASVCSSIKWPHDTSDHTGMKTAEAKQCTAVHAVSSTAHTHQEPQAREGGSALHPFRIDLVQKLDPEPTPQSTLTSTHQGQTPHSCPKFTSCVHNLCLHPKSTPQVYIPGPHPTSTP